MPRLLFDAQSLQTESRGLGRFAWSLLSALEKAAQSTGQWDIDVLISPLRLSFIRGRPVTGGAWLEGFEEASSFNQVIAEWAIQDYDVALFPSLFEGLDESGVATPSGTKAVFGASTAVVVHDVIPLIFPDQYFPVHPKYQEWYLKKLAFINDADVIFAVSEATKRDVIERLHIDAARITVIGAGVANSFRQLSSEQQEEWKRRFRQTYGIDRGFILYVASDDEWRKNIEGLIRAYALLPHRWQQETQLVIVGRVPEARRKYYQTIIKQSETPASIIFPGQVSDDELVGFYNLAYVFVFPSFYEGFGLPAIEAVRCGTAVLGSNLSSLPEVLGRSDCLFDPSHPETIADRLLFALEHPSWVQDLAKAQQASTAGFTWENTGGKVLNALSRLVDLKGSTSPSRLGRMKNSWNVALVTPLPPLHTGVAEYARDLVPTLSRSFPIVLVAEDPNEVVKGDFLTCNYPFIDSTQWDARGGLPLFQIGNNGDFHAYMLPLLNKWGGAVTLHDVVLDGLAGFVAANPTLMGQLVTGAEREIWAAAQNLVEPDKSSLLAHLLLDWIVRHCDGIIIHSEFAKRMVQELIPGIDIPLFVIPHGIGRRFKTSKVAKPSQGRVIIGAFGNVHPVKGLERLIEAAGRSGVKERVELLIVGEGGDEYISVLRNAASDYGVRVTFTGWVSDEEWAKALGRVDIVVSLREESRGESSGPVHQALGWGKAVIVEAVGANVELPDHVVRKVNRRDVVGLSRTIEELVEDPVLRHQYGQNAIQWVEEERSWGRIGDLYREALETIYSVRQSRRKVASKVAVPRSVSLLLR
ncbi:MAG: glycosyltransferase [Firmicutes bacterium]|nr:glycosyltransferase [Alicyclobacillaceae bacterium]MCL6497437.1 glycosyltransferase [Bacillota bacterium]